MIKADNWTVDKEKIDLIKRTICKEASDQEFELFRALCQRSGLDPFMKQIYPIFRNVKNPKTGGWDRVMTTQTSIDGFRSLAERTGKYAPGKETVYKYGEDKELISATAFVKKMTADGTWHEVAVTAFLSEYTQKGQFWESMKHNQLSKCAESLALRKAFPFELAGIYTSDEMVNSVTASQMDDIDQSVISDVPTKKVDLKPSNKVSEAYLVLDSLDELKVLLEQDGIPSDKLVDWIKIRCDLKNEQPETIAKACLGKEILPKFKKSFINWLQSTGSELTSAVI